MMKICRNHQATQTEATLNEFADTSSDSARGIRCSFVRNDNARLQGAKIDIIAEDCSVSKRIGNVPESRLTKTGRALSRTAPPANTTDWVGPAPIVKHPPRTGVRYWRRHGMSSDVQRPMYGHPESQRRRGDEQSGRGNWSGPQVAGRVEGAGASGSVVRIMSTTVYCTPFAYTGNGEPLFLQYGTAGAAEAARVSHGMNVYHSGFSGQGPGDSREEGYRGSLYGGRQWRYWEHGPGTERYESYDHGYHGRGGMYESGYDGAGGQHTRHDYERGGGRYGEGPAGREGVVAGGAGHCDDSRYAEDCGGPGAASGGHLDKEGMRMSQERNDGGKDTRKEGEREETAAAGDREDRGAGHKVAATRTYRDYSQVGGAGERADDGDATSKGGGPGGAQGGAQGGAPGGAQGSAAGGADGAEWSEVGPERGGKREMERGGAEGEWGGKRSRLNWSEGLHSRFLQAVEEIGIERAVPTSIMKVMQADGVTRENVASHLQKYRGTLKREREEAERQLLLKAAKHALGDAAPGGDALTDAEVLRAVAARERAGAPGAKPARRKSTSDAKGGADAPAPPPPKPKRKERRDAA